MKEIMGYKDKRPAHVEGKVCIALTDPVTGKIKEKVEGKNHVFPDTLFAYTFSVASWKPRVSDAWMCLNDDDTAIDTTFPYLRGQTIAYGRPSMGSSGTFRGAYNAANQVLAQQTAEKTRWKFQYDFTTAQGNAGTIKNVGLTRQYEGIKSPGYLLSGFEMSLATVVATYTNDGRYAYNCSTAGVITVYDTWGNLSTTTKDVSAVVGNVTANTKCVAYEPSTGKFYVYVYSSTASDRKVYQFSDKTFTSLESTYTPTNATASGYTAAYVGNGCMYFLSSAATASKLDFVNNIYTASFTLGTYNNAAYTESTAAATLRKASVMQCAIGDYVYISGGDNNNTSDASKGVIFNPVTGSVIAWVAPLQKPSQSYYPIGSLDPISSSKIFTAAGMHAAAFTTYILPSPITKTSANGMTAIYELEVFWE